ncbi:sulfite reductase subunit alpha [Cellvibrio japonicus]|uniref:Molybdopterin oxidoreductase Fe4S4 domain family n=1 Tax=Cellvibrio japonicus (strain Ueda107) TaxID=498211 RepID=B3PCP4_CELJU|nr:sulfite reductase subunit alpha [Cellvibrio japonicus]ACE86176.1 Molybdopterin oxidoreductase Fe4S4 domain family [Cellvibrio japonicus Ueda107]QEI13269.1 sulfite reductase subunit alpha [Cellvibrio japonicus]QEI16843.1 sulfite reductase subunit alpha [Cellvibrio japonicus]QEI20421.1 sulfite reductase subunit alpha [Cellvibrio japonicus]
MPDSVLPASSAVVLSSGPRAVRSVCPYCGVGCGMILETDGIRVTKVSGDKQHPSNQGRLCTKGQTSAQALANSGRMESAFVRRERQRDPVKTPMAEAIATTARRLRDILDTHGPEAISFYVSGQMSIEAQYLANKLAKGFIRTNLIESNSRLCMASAGTGYKLSLGSDAPPGSYQDFDHTDLFLVIGANMADCHPILYLRMMDRVKAGAKLIVVDPRRTTTAEKANLYLPIKPGTDLALLNGLLYLLHRQGSIDADFIARYTQGWEVFPEFLADYTPDKVSAITGLAVDAIVQAANLIGAAPEFITCWTMGLNQSTHGTWSTNAICNLHLATGKICRLGSGPFSLTGQPNAMGGREMGYMGPGLPGQRTLLVEEDRHFIENLWQLEPGSLRTQVGKGTVDLFQRMAQGDIKACWIICTNPVASIPNRQSVIDALQTAELVIAQDAFLDTETNRYADILLPGALWAEAEGVMINSERNLTLMQPAVKPPGEAMADWEIIARVAQAMGYAEHFDFPSAEAVFEEIKRTYNPNTGYDLRGASYARLRETPLQWPCAEQGSERNPIRYINSGIHQPLAINPDGSKPELRFATGSGKAVFHARPHVEPAEMPDAEFPLILNTGRVQHQWHTLTKTGKIPTLNKLNPGTFVEIHPQDAAELGINNKDKVEIRSRRGYAVLPAVVTDRVQPGCCFAPIHWNDVYGENLCINALTSDHVDPLSQQPELKIAAVALQRVQVFASDEGAQRSRDSIVDYALSPVAFAAVAEETSMTLIKTFAEKIGVQEVATPALSAQEQQYLSGYISGLNASANALAAVPALPADAPVAPAHKLWINGLLAGMFSRVLPLGVVAPQAEPGKPELLLLWASQTGNAEALAETFSGQLGQQGWSVRLQAMNDLSLDQLAAARYAVFITSTFGDGDSPDNGGTFWQQLNADPAPALADLQFALLALGDSNYDQFCGHGKKLYARLQALGAKPLLERVDCDTDFEAPAQAWFAKLMEQLAPQVSQDKNPVSMTVTNPASATTGYSKANPYPARLVVNRTLSGEGSGKDVRQFGFDLGDSGLTYEAGDALGVWPQNCPDYVFELEQALNFNADAPVVVDTREKPLQQALLENYEICRPNLELLHFIAERAAGGELKTLLDAEHKKALQDWLYGRQLVDILQEFPIRTSLEEFLPLLKRLQPRLYSIASSPKACPQQVHLTVSAVRYNRFHGSMKMRKGVASTFLADRAQDVDVPIFVQPSKHFHVPEQGDAPMIMVGPGTGIAPFRGFLQERQARGDRGKNWLFFGEQHAASDFYYQDELRQFQQEGVLTHLSLAFSRDQAQKIYVQDRMREQAAQLWEWLEQGAYFYVCGDASRMAKDVDQALRDIIQQYGKLDEAETVNYIRKLNMDKRYLRDVY